MIRPLLFRLLVLPLAAAATQQGKFPWTAGDAPPLVAGVPLAASRARLDTLLGTPTDSQPLRADAWAFNFRARVAGKWAVVLTLDSALTSVVELGLSRGAASHQ